MSSHSIRTAMNDRASAKIRRTAAAPSTSATPNVAEAPVGGSRAWLREPLVHFLVLGALVFAIDAAIIAQRDDPSTIVLGASDDKEIRQIFSTAQGREPSETELAALRRRWFDNELLYREGLALGLDRGDSAIRERVIFKALNVVGADLRVPDVSDEALQAWFEQNRSRYDEPPRIDLLEAVIGGNPPREDIEAFARALNEGTQTETTSGLRVFRGRPVASITEGFGEDFTKALNGMPTGTWQVLDSKDGPRAVRVEARKAAVPADFAKVRDAVVLDWRDQMMQKLRTDAVRSLETKYALRIAGEGK